MKINIEYKEESGGFGTIGILQALARYLNCDIQNDRIYIPEKYGQGYFQRFRFSPGLEMLISNCKFKHDLTIKKAKTADVKSGDTIVLALQNVLQKGGTISAEPGAAGVLAIGLSTGIQIPENTDFGIILIIIEALYLRKLVDEKFENSVLENIIDTKQTIILDRRMSASIARIADEIAVAEIPEIFQHFYYKVKAEELICHLFIKLTSRQKSPLDSLNISDVEAIYKVRAILLKHLSNPPTVTQLAKMANMSESKLKRLFKQIFGTSVFNYYQSFRMKEAARMLKQRKFTVKEVANKLGFINLSHFSKIFAAYNGEKPKKYSMN